ncbi:patatin-like phospholipase family protein [Moraxella caviae]|nr:patatin-like phospholipase family protein [Moraxella caviae]
MNTAFFVNARPITAKVYYALMGVFALIATLFISGCASTPAAPAASVSADKPTVALVLGGGGARGFAHIGVIDALESSGIRPDMVVGTSAGAMVGALYASGKSPKELSKLAQSFNQNDVIVIKPSQDGLLDGDKIREFINANVNNQPIEKLPMRFVAVATDSRTKTAATFRQGDTGFAVQASSSLPKLFAPVSINGVRYVDGGQSALVPARVARSLGADVVISVDLMGYAPAKNASTPSVEIERNDKGVKLAWGKDTLELPINLDGLNKQMKDLPISINVEKLLSFIPKKASIPLPQGAPENLPTSKQDIAKFINLANIGTNAKTNPADLAASDVVIAPDLSAFLVFDTGERTALMDAGRNAANAALPQIKSAIKEHRK